MKNIRLVGLSLVVGLLLTSCLGEGGNKIQLLDQSAVYISDSVGYFLLKGGELVKTTYNAEDMDCFQINLNIDLYEDADGIYDADLVGTPQKLEVWRVPNDSITDTLNLPLFEKERFITTLLGREACILNQFFLASAHSVVDSTEINNRYDLTFDPKQTGTPNSEVGENVYQLYLRAYEEKAGAKVTDVSAARRRVNVFDMTNFYNAFAPVEKEKNKAEIYFTIRYAKSFNNDTTEINWGDSPIYQIPIQY